MNLKQMEKTAREVMEKNGQHMPQMMLVRPDKKLIMMAMPFSDDAEKEQLLFVMRKLISNVGVKKYFLVMEGWMLERDMDDKSEYVRPRDSENRIECLIISEFRKDMKNKNIMIQFTRDSDKIVWGKRIVFTPNKDETYQSRWNFFVEDAVDEYIDNMMKGVKK